MKRLCLVPGLIYPRGALAALLLCYLPLAMSQARNPVCSPLGGLWGVLLHKKQLQPGRESRPKQVLTQDSRFIFTSAELLPDRNTDSQSQPQPPPSRGVTS